MREVLGWVCILLVFGGVLVALVGGVVVKFSKLLGLKDSAVLKWALVALIGIAMIACGLIYNRLIGPEPGPVRQEPVGTDDGT